MEKSKMILTILGTPFSNLIVLILIEEWLLKKTLRRVQNIFRTLQSSLMKPEQFWFIQAFLESNFLIWKKMTWLESPENKKILKGSLELLFSRAKPWEILQIKVVLRKDYQILHFSVVHLKKIVIISSQKENLKIIAKKCS